MRAKEFTINVPITITINGDDDPVVDAGNTIPVDVAPVVDARTTVPADDDTELQQNPVMVSPQQQELELKKAAAGKGSPVINKLTGQETVGEEPIEQNDIIQRLRALMSK